MEPHADRIGVMLWDPSGHGPQKFPHTREDAGRRGEELFVEDLQVATEDGPSFRRAWVGPPEDTHEFAENVEIGSAAEVDVEGAETSAAPLDDGAFERPAARSARVEQSPVDVEEQNDLGPVGSRGRGDYVPVSGHSE